MHLSAAWNRPTLELVVFLQDTLTKEVLNGNKVSLDHVGLSEPGIHAAICPNPAPDWFMIKCEERVEHVSLFDHTGRCVMKQTFGIFNPVVRVDGMKNGFYVVRILTSSGETTRKVFIE